MTKSLLVAVVGGFFRPPAKQVMSVVPTGHTLGLQPEPDNPYDPLAIRVLLDPASIPGDLHEHLHLALEGSGFPVDEVLMLTEPLHVGYVGKSGGKPMLKADCVDGNREVLEWAEALGWLDLDGFEATLGFSAGGLMQLRITVREGQGEQSIVEKTPTSTMRREDSHPDDPNARVYLPGHPNY